MRIALIVLAVLVLAGCGESNHLPTACHNAVKPDKPDT
jgi:hypothetical protein